jgi:type II secretory pathway pseudopilin PulG
MVGIVVSLLIVGLLSLVVLRSVGGGMATSKDASSLGASVALAYDVQAQSTLSNTMQNVRDALVSNGNASVLNLAQFGVTAGPSNAPSTVSGAVSDTGDPADLGAASGSGSVTLAAWSKSGTCWFVWFSASATWYGAEPGSSSCLAQPLSGEPSPGAPSAGSVGWQQGSFPSS